MSKNAYGVAIATLYPTYLKHFSPAGPPNRFRNVTYTYVFW